MKKNEKIIIGILVLITIIMIGILVITKTKIWKKVENIANQEPEKRQIIINAQQDSYTSFYGKVIESNPKYILVEPNETEEIRKSADKVEIGLKDNNDDTIYEIGTNVKITYKGYIMESYPAKVDVVNIEIKSTDKFEIRFYDKQPQGETKVNKILDKSETDKYNYNIYTYDAQVNIIINGEEISLKKALLENKITMDEIIAKANQDLQDKKINGYMYKDGGSMVYQYDNYTITKYHTIDGNRDVYIGHQN